MNIRVNSNLYNNNANNQVSDMLHTEEGSATDSLRSLARQIVNMNVGDVFTGRIANLNGKSIELLLSDKSTVQAKLSSPMQLQAGQTMSFEVSSNAGGKVQLTPLYANLSGESQVARALGEAGLPFDARNSEMVKSMMEQGMKIDADSLLSMARNVNSFPNAAPSSVVSMTALRIPLTETNVAQFEIYRNNAHQIADHASGIAGGFAEVASESLPTNKMILNVFMGETDPGMTGLLEAAKAEAALNTENGATVEQSGQEQNAVSGDMTDANATTETADGRKVVVNVEEGQQATVTEGTESGQKTADGNVLPEISGGGGSNTKTAFYGDNTVSNEVTELFTPEEREKLAESMKEIDIPENLAEKVKNGELSTRDTLNLIRSAMDQALKSGSEIPEEALKHLSEKADQMLKSPEYSKLVKNEIMNELLMEPEDVADKEKIQEYFQKVIKQTAQAAEVLQSTGHGDTTLAAGNKELHNNIDFMNQINQMFTYMQVPLKMSSEAQHGDLYVYTNKKKLQSGDGNVSALLHLDMTHLGTMDIHVSMKPSGVVNTHFILQKEEMLDFIAEHLPELDKRINARGYNISSDVSLNKEKTSVPEIMFNKGKDTRLIQYTAFDAKA